MRHKTDLDIRFYSVLYVCIENAIENRPVIDRFSLRIFVVSACRAPFQSGSTIARSQEIVRAKVDPSRIELPKFGDQLLAVLHVSVVRFIGTKETPDGAYCSQGFGGVDLDVNGETVSSSEFSSDFSRAGKEQRCE